MGNACGHKHSIETVESTTQGQQSTTMENNKKNKEEEFDNKIMAVKVKQDNHKEKREKKKGKKNRDKDKEKEKGKKEIKFKDIESSKEISKEMTALPQKSKPKSKKEDKNSAQKTAEILQENIAISAEMLVTENKEAVNKNYTAVKVIGEGSFGKVYKVRHKFNGNLYALKIVRNNSGKSSKASKAEQGKNVMNELLILKKLEHPNIMKVYEYFTNESYIYIIMEFISGGELYDHICSLKFYDEYHAAFIMKQIFSVISYMNQMGIVHRDLKPENMMTSSMTKNEKEIEIKVIDFGTACFLREGEKLKTKVGSPFYISPEVLMGNYGKECDVWSAGVIMYILLIGSPPFDGRNTAEIFRKILNERPNFKLKEFDYVSPEAIDLLEKLLEKDVRKRITAADALLHPWIKAYVDGKDCNSKSKSNLNLGISLKNCLQTFSSKQKLHQASVAFIVHQMSNSKMVRKLTKIFKELDTSGEGLLSKEELKQGYKKFFTESITDKEFDEIMKTIDQDQSGQISIEEFLRATVNYENLVTENNLKNAFDYFDKDHNGFLTPDEIRDVLGLGEEDESSKIVVDEIIKDVDLNGDGIISYDEFKLMMVKKKSLFASDKNSAKDEDDT